MRSDRRDEDLFDETRLRRALRLEAAELPPRLDIAAIAARARADRPAFAAASLVSTLVAGVAAAGLVGLIAVAFPAVAPALASDLFTAAIETVTRIAIPASALLSLAQQPTVPIAAIAALAVAIVHEYAQRREPVREITS
jgi:dihydrodipicolinate synthase/N-acetylneuraminate lyase